MMLHFVPGFALARLEELAVEVGKPKAKVLRALLDMHVEEDEREWFSAYEFTTKAGQEIKKLSALWWKESGRERKILRIGEKVKILAKGLDLSGLAYFKYIQESEDSESGKVAMNFDPKDMSGKLARLSEVSGLTKTGVLRYLILRMPLPSRIRKKTQGRIAQVGGLLKHVASGRSNAIYGLGCSICDLAWGGKKR